MTDGIEESEEVQNSVNGNLLCSLAQRFVFRGDPLRRFLLFIQ